MSAPGGATPFGQVDPDNIGAIGGAPAPQGAMPSSGASQGAPQPQGGGSNPLQALQALMPQLAGRISIGKGGPKITLSGSSGGGGLRGGRGRSRSSRRGRSYGPPPVKAAATPQETSSSNKVTNPETGRSIGKRPGGEGPRAQLEQLLRGAPDWAQIYSGRPGRSEVPPEYRDIEFAEKHPNSRTNNKFDARFGRGAQQRFYEAASEEEFGSGDYHPRQSHDAVAPTADELGAGTGEALQQETASAGPSDEELIATVAATMGGGAPQEAPPQAAPIPQGDGGIQAQFMRWIGKQIGR